MMAVRTLAVYLYMVAVLGPPQGKPQIVKVRNIFCIL